MKKSVKILHWAPRIIAILAILFVSIFAADSFGTERTIGQQMRDFFMHLIPSFVLIVVLIVAWKKELIGGIIFTILGLGLSLEIFRHNYNMNQSVAMSLWPVLTLTFPFVLVGVLFIISHFVKKKQQLKVDTDE